MNSKLREALYEMYDEAAEEYRRNIKETTTSEDTTQKNTSRFNAREWVKRMRWLDDTLKVNGEE